MASDFSTSVDTWRHAWFKAEEYFDQTFDISVLLEPTSPLRKSKDVEEVIKKMVDGGYDSVFTVSETDSKSHPLKQMVIKDNHVGYYDDAGKDIIARQQLTPVYHRNGVAYAITRKCLVEQKTITGSNASAVIIDEPLVNIDTKHDLMIAQFLMSG
jgi:CMP-N,N'-diacetyllegionaminic acid synthase